MAVEQPGLGHHERADAGRAHHRAASRPLAQHRGAVADVGPCQRRRQRIRHLEPDCRHHDAIGPPRVDCRHGNGEAVRDLDVLPHAHGPHLKTRHCQPAQLDQFVCRRKGVEDDGQARVEDAVENEHIHAHGNNDTKSGVLASRLPAHRDLRSD